MKRRLTLGLVVMVTVACAPAAQYPSVGKLVSTARADQLAFVTEYQKKGLAFRGTVQKKGVKPATATGFDFTAYGLNGGPGGLVVGSAQSRRVNVNYGYVFLGEGNAEDKRAVCLFEPDNLKEAAELQVGQPATLTCMFSKFVGNDAEATPVFWGCSVLP